MKNIHLHSGNGRDGFDDESVHSPPWTFPLARYALLCVLFWSAAVGSFAVWSLGQQRAYLLDLARREARGVFDKNLFMLRWSARLGETYLPLTKESLQSAGSAPDPAQVVTTESGKRLARISPAAVTRHLLALQEESGGVQSHLRSLTPGRAANAPDDWERSALTSFTHGEPQASTEALVGGERYLRLMWPVMAEKACLACHDSKLHQENDILGGISVSVPMRQIISAQSEHRNRTLYGIGSIWLLGMAMIGAGFARIRYQEQARLATEMALRDSEAEFRMLAENANDVIWTIDLDGRFSYVSPSVERQTGYTPQEVLRRGFQDMLTPGSLSMIKEKFQAAVAEVVSGNRIKGERLEVEQVAKDGSRIWFDVTFNPIYAPSGEFTCFMGVSRNITARMRAEAALRVSEEKYRSIFESFQDIYYRTDMNGILTDITPSVAVWGGYTQEEALGREVASFYADPKARSLMLQQLQETGTLHDFETQLKRKDGSLVEASLTARLLFDSDGRPAGVEGILRDITERKQSEAKLRELSLKDELTGLNNRRGFMTLASQQMKGVERYRQFVALIYADLDKMKWINDNLGHKEGDRALVDTTDILRNSFRSCDIIARLGGDEFVGFAVIQSENDAELLLARLRESLNLHNERASRPYPLSISFGLAIYDPQAPCTLTELMERADGVMYLQKQQRGSRRAPADQVQTEQAGLKRMQELP